MLQVIFKLPATYPFAPPAVTACLSCKTKLEKQQDRRQLKGKEKDDDTALPALIDDDDDGLADELDNDTELDPSLYDQSVTSLLQEQVLAIILTKCNEN